jgi:hypothetical protein
VEYLSNDETADLCNRTIARCNDVIDAVLLRSESIDPVQMKYFRVARKLAMRILQLAEAGETVPRVQVDRMLTAVRSDPAV